MKQSDSELPSKKPRKAKKPIEVSESVRQLAENLRSKRLRAGLSQPELAAAAELDYKHYQKIEGGKWPGVRLETVERLAKALKVSVASLLTTRKVMVP